MKTRLQLYASLMRLDRPIGIYLLLWPTLWAVWIAGQGQPHWLVAVVFVAGVVLMRSAGCIINDYADKDFDPHVQRTKERPLATAKISKKEALTLFIVLCLVAFGLVLLMNQLTILLSFIALFLAMTYPFMKRYTDFPQAYLGITFGWSIPMAFAAQMNTVPLLAWELLAANILWTIAYDTKYAMVDREDDVKIGVKSTAILFGQWDKLIVAILDGCVILILWDIGQQLTMTWPYYMGLFTASGLLVYQQWLVKDRLPQPCFQAFLNNHWVGMSIFFGIFFHYYVV